tara:strand:+ start:611 stop:1087 length:477 start_codon:yes stop_codon:yes gene_type:complete
MTLTVKQVGWMQFGDVEPLRLSLSALERERSPAAARGYDAQARFTGSLDLAGRLNDDNVLTWVCYDGAEAVGYLQIEKGSFYGSGSGLTVIDRGWYVKPAYRPRAGQLLALAARGAIKAARAEVMQALVSEENAGMVALMRTQGWRPVATVYEREVPT